jgi:hypothetical protein
MHTITPLLAAAIDADRLRSGNPGRRHRPTRARRRPGRRLNPVLRYLASR